MKLSTQDLTVLAFCFLVPVLALVLIHFLRHPFFIPLRSSTDGQVWFVLAGGELLYLISRFIRKQ